MTAWARERYGRRAPHKPLAEDEILVEVLPQRQGLLIQAFQDVETVDHLQGVDARRLEGPCFKEHAKQEDVRAKHERRVVDDF